MHGLSGAKADTFQKTAKTFILPKAIDTRIGIHVKQRTRTLLVTGVQLIESRREVAESSENDRHVQARVIPRCIPQRSNLSEEVVDLAP